MAVLQLTYYEAYDVFPLRPLRVHKYTRNIILLSYKY